MIKHRDMMIEQTTNYAYKLKYMENPTFDKMRDLSTKFYRELPQALQDELFEALKRGVDILDSEPLMTAYLFAFGKMHQAKLNHAYGKLPEDFLEQKEINIIDYGCGQALGTMCYADFLRKTGYLQKVKTITLIEPSEICLKRAALHASVFFPDAEIKTVNETFDELDEDDIYCDEDVPTLHILSNVLDILDFDLERFANLIKDHIKGYNQFICVGPYFNYSFKDERMEEFCSLLKGDEYYGEFFDKYEFDENKAWTAQISCFSVVILLSTEVTEYDINNGIEDAFGVVYSRDGEKLLKCKNPKLEIYAIKQGTKIICDDAFPIFDDDIPVSISPLKRITIPDSVIVIGKGAFEGCEHLQIINVPHSIKTIKSRAFHGCSSLQYIIIPNSISYIGDSAFRGCRSLKIIIIPNSITYIAAKTFANCSSLIQVLIPDSVTEIGFAAFGNCSSIQEITIPNSVNSIDGYAFKGCSSLQQVYIPNAINNIGENPFLGCINLNSTCNSSRFVIQSGLLIDSYYDSIISYFGHDINVIIPNTITHVGAGAFSGCRSIQQIVIPRGSIQHFKKMLEKELWNKLVEQ